MQIDDAKDKDNKDVLIIDRGLVKGKIKIHGVNPSLLLEKILRERIQDSHYWYLKVSNLQFYQLLDECVNNIVIVGTYIDNSHSKPCMFVSLLFRLIQLQPPNDIVEWIIIGNHKFKYLSILFMLYARLMWEDSKKIWLIFEQKLSDFRKIRIVENNIVKIVHFDEIVDSLLINDKFLDIALPRLINRWVLEDSGELDQRESVLIDEFEDEIDQIDNDDD